MKVTPNSQRTPFVPKKKTIYNETKIRVPSFKIIFHIITMFEYNDLE